MVARGKKFGRWETVKELDVQSGQGRLFIVQDSQAEFPGDFVCKLLKNERRFPRFQIEVGMTNTLARSGCHVVEVVDALMPPDGKGAYYVTRYYSKGDLRRVISEGAYAGDLSKAFRLFERLYVDLRDIHRTTAHRDLKPENILINDDENPMFCDFGLCMPLWEDDAQRRSASLEQIGSRHYIAPEALGGYKAVVNPIALDVYSMGKILYELLIGRPLPGVEVPDGDLSVTSMHSGDGWYLANALITDMVSHQPSVRMQAWERVPHVCDLVYMATDQSVQPDDPNKLEIRIRKSLDENERARRVKQEQERNLAFDTFREQLAAQIVAGFDDSPGVQRIRDISSGSPPLFQVDSGVSLSPSWFDNFVGIPLELPVAIFRLQRDGASIPHLTASWANPFEFPLVRVAVHFVTDRMDNTISLSFVLHRAKQSSAAGWDIMRPEVFTQGLVGQAGDSTFLAEARSTARAFADRWVNWFAETASE